MPRFDSSISKYAQSQAARLKLKEDKKKLFTKLIKKYVASKKSSVYEKNYIYISMYDFFYDNEKELSKYWNDDIDTFIEEAYIFRFYEIDITGYIREEKIQESLGWSRSNSKSYLESITYIMKPCKEFDSLNKYIVNTLKCKPLTINDVCSYTMHGKRSSVHDRTNQVFLAHDPELCKKYKMLLQKTKKPNWKVTISISNTQDYGDRYNSYGQDRECEWEGENVIYAKVTFTTPSGKQMAQIRILPY